MMCLGIIANARIKNTYYSLENKKHGFIKSNHTFDLSKMSVHQVKNTDQNIIFKKIMQDFF